MGKYDGYYMYHIAQQMVGGSTETLLHEDLYDDFELRQKYEEAKEEVLAQIDESEVEEEGLFNKILIELEESFGFKSRDDRDYTAYIKVIDE